MKNSQSGRQGCWLWRGLAWAKSWRGVAILTRGIEPEETQRDLPLNPDDMHSQYIEADINSIRIGCLYLPNGDPAPT